MDFYQESWNVDNEYTQDTALQSFLKRMLPETVFREVDNDLTRLGARVGTKGDLTELSEAINRQLPYLQQYDHMGHRIDTIHTSAAWKKMHEISAQEGFVSIGYEQKHAEWSRLYQFAKISIYAPSAGLYTCPLAMTDGAACLLTQLVKSSNNPHLKETLSRLITRDPSRFWTSGQWMTERGGGSDVGEGTGTVARTTPHGYALHGVKWFTSATDANVAITLARIEDGNGRTTPGSAGLSCFLVKLRDDNGRLQNIKVLRLKDKLGTKQVPTAELELCGAPAILLSPPGKGVKTIATLINITRVYNATSAVGGMRRVLSLQRDWIHKRKVFGRSLAEQPAHMETLAQLEVEYRGGLALTLEASRLLGHVEQGVASDMERALFRLIVPLVKLYTGKQAVATASEGLEAFGGAGYIEDTGLPQMLRDAQVLPIWEGTTNVLSHDVLRVLSKEKQTYPTFEKMVRAQIKAAASSRWVGEGEEIGRQLTQLSSLFPGVVTRVSVSRYLAFALSRIYISTLLLQHAVWSGEDVDGMVLQRWLLTPTLHPLLLQSSSNNDNALARALFTTPRSRL